MCPLRGLRRSGGVVAVEVKRAGVDDPFALKFLGEKRQARIALPEHGAFAAGIDKDERLLAVTLGRGEEMSFHAEALEFSAMEQCRMILAEFADITRSQAPLLAGGHGGSDLSAEERVGGMNFYF